MTNNFLTQLKQLNWFSGKTDELARKLIKKSKEKFVSVFSVDFTTFPKVMNIPELFSLYANADFLLPDGMSVVKFLKLIQNFKNSKILNSTERTTGVDLTFKLIQLSNTQLILVGSKEEVLIKAISKLQEKGKKVLYYHHGYFKPHSKEENQIIENIMKVWELNNTNPFIIICGMGAFKQELFSYKLKKNFEVKSLLNTKSPIFFPIILAVGGTIDVIAGEVKRAPKSWQEKGAEWLWRIIHQPQRIKRLIPSSYAWLKLIFQSIL